MTLSVNETHDPNRRSWVQAANEHGADFPIQNLPFGRFRRKGAEPRAGVAIGDSILDLGAALEKNIFSGAAEHAALAAVESDDLAPLLRLGRPAASALRARLVDFLDADGSEKGRAKALRDDILVKIADVEMHLPLAIRQFSDMCVSTFHIGRRRGIDKNGQPLCPPVFRTIPVGYDGRASSVIISGTPVRRPYGTWQATDESPPQFGPEPRQDYELELGIWVGGPGNALGTPIPIDAADDAVFGYTLLNDWSARGIQFWETMLGPFLGKSLSTTVSPWIVTAEAMAPFRCAAFERPACDPAVPRQLYDDADQKNGGLDLVMEAYLESRTMRDANLAPMRVCRTNFNYMYWTPAQMVSHHSSNGCSMAAGDLLGSGTCSGPDIEEAGCLVEKREGGPWQLPTGEQREWLEDEDIVTLRGRAEKAGFVGIGFGEATGMLLPALDL